MGNAFFGGPDTFCCKFSLLIVLLVRNPIQATIVLFVNSDTEDILK